MKLSYNWLNDFADFNAIPFAKLHEKISLSICEVDSVAEYNQFLETILVAKILETKKHPDADKLTICQADIGSKKLQIVTAASVQVGDIVPLAMIGTMLLDGKEIGEGKLRGIDSFGMFCSEKELGLAEESAGLMLLPNDSILGTSLRKVLEMEDQILLIDNKSITHRPDLWSHFGFARELAAQLNIPLKFNPFEAKFSYSEITSPNVIENKNAHSYFAVNIEKVQIQPSIRKFSSRLQRCGIKSINNVVDVSNYVMLEMGQPTHFFDREKLGNISLSVEFAKDKETLALLDKTVKELNSNILTIRNNSEAVAIAGIMGGEDSAISNSTKNIILESACFRRENIRKSIQITKIRTEAAMRYEKGLDSSSSMPVINRSLQLLKENGCGDFSASKPAGFESVKKIKTIETSFDFINQKLGTVFEEKIILDILNRLGFSVKSLESKLNIIAPTYRQNYDITLEEDIVEEVGRSLGYAAIDYKPILSEVKPIILSKRRSLERKLKNLFCSEFAYSEVFNYSFASKQDVQFETIDSDSLKIANSMPEEFTHLRTSMYPSLIKHLKINSDRFNQVKIFELGRTYQKTKKDELAEEKRFFSFGFLNNRKASEISDMEEDFFSVRNMIQRVLESFGIESIEMKKTDTNYFHPNANIQFCYSDSLIAELGYIHPMKMDEYGLKKNCILGKIDFLKLESILETPFKSPFKVPSQFPNGQIDLSLVMLDSENTNTFPSELQKENIIEIEEIWVQTIFKGGNLDANKKSVTYRMNLMNYTETFTADSVQIILNKCIEVAKQKGFQLR